MEQLQIRYERETGRKPGEIYTWENGSLEAAKSYTERRGGARIYDPKVHHEMFLDVKRLEKGDFKIYMLGSNKDSKGKIRNFYVEEDHVSENIVSAPIKSLVAGSNLTIHLVANTPEELNQQLEQFFHSIYQRQQASYKSPKEFRTVQLTNKLGLHARPSALLVKAVKPRYDETCESIEVYDKSNKKRANVRSIMSLMTLEAFKDHILRFEVRGSESGACLDDIVKTMASPDFV